MSNPHISNAIDWQHGDDEPSAFALQNAQIEATLAVAYELRTANLIAMWSNPQSTAHQSTYTLSDVTLKDLLQRSLERLDTQDDGTVAP
jgi:hypothetical protein